MPRATPILCLLIALAARFSARAADPSIPDTIDFNRDITPILSENCFFCHGPDKNKRKADLRLDTKEGLFAAIEQTRFPVVPGRPAQSEIYKRITTDDDADRMPDPKSGKHLSAKQIGLIKAWIEQGAPYKGHWAYEKPTRGSVPQIEVSNPIDAFLLAKLHQYKLQFSPQADRVTLIRRLYFDLLGLPPTPARVDAFVNDKSPDAYEKLVESLLASPHFGERMAVYWLDLVRFADTIGYHSDNPRDITPYRDWVIEAFNKNMPFDQFTIEQLAGDLLKDATTSQKVASGYNRLLQTTEEGGAQPKEYAAKYLADRVRNYSSVWLAGTLACAECHDHKFDPFSTKDFYSTGAFFADVREAAVGKREQGMPVPDEKQAAELARLDGLIVAARKTVDTSTTELAEAQRKWEESLTKSAPAVWTVLTPQDAAAESGVLLKIGKDQSVLATGKAKATDTYFVTARTNVKNITAVRLEALTDSSLPKNGPGRADNGNFVLTEIIVQSRGRASGDPAVIKLQNASATFEQTSFVGENPYKLWTPAAAIDGDVKGALWGWAILGQEGKDHHAVFETAADVNSEGAQITLSFVLRQQHKDKHNLGKFRLSVTNSPRPVKAGKELPKDISEVLAIAADQRAPEQKSKLSAYYRGISSLLEPARLELAKHEKAKDEFLKTVRKSLIAVAEAPKPLRVLRRGNWMDDGGEPVAPAVPHFLPQIQPPSSHPKGRPTRLDLAHWTVSPDNPLTARVVVNRLWRTFYGIGISKSLEDFGAQGESPTHPQLLDWLACEFQDRGWDVKHMIRLMVTSQAYRQSSHTPAKLKEIDPFNRLAARQARFRLDAEFVRDNALAVAGLLVTRIGGESVKPYQPDGYWDFLNFPKRTYRHDGGESQYRRGLYTHWQRTFTHPSLVNFDAPSREECTAERTRSNTPQQALTLLNDPTYVEAARVFARRIIKECDSSDPTRRIVWAWQTALQRRPRPEEVRVLSDLYTRHRQQYAHDAKAAEALVSAGEAPRDRATDPAELAAWTSVSRAILNLHETITRN